MSLEDAKKLALSCLKETMEEKISKSNVEMMVISDERKQVERVSPEQIKAILEQLKWLWFRCAMYAFSFYHNWFEYNLNYF